MPNATQKILYAKGLKECGRCHIVLPFAEYNQRKEGGKWYCVAYCKQCERDKYLENRDSIREIRRQHRTGAPIGTYNFLVAEYGEQCAICKSKNPRGTSSESGQFHIDHDHKTGNIRGLLCSTCNVGIRMLMHDEQLLLAAISYLARPGHSVEALEEFISPKLSDSIELSAEELEL